MSPKNILSQLNIIAQCRRYGSPLRQCPQFIFLIMGLVIIISSINTYLIGIYYIESPELVALIVLLSTTILFISAFIITQSFEKLAEVNRMRAEFINIVSHQLRAPLTNLKWTVEFLISDETNGVREKQREYFDILKENTVRMEELVNNLITVSRLQEGALPLKKEEINLENLIKEVAQKTEPFAQASAVEIGTNFEKDIPLIYADPLRIKSVIENLIDNAIRYAFKKRKEEELIEEKKKIEITLKRKNGKVCFEAKDNGIGIPKGEQKYIFQKFFRAKNVLECQTQGSGLGLYIAKSIVEKSGGKIGFTSEENKGSTFWFTLPIK